MQTITKRNPEIDVAKGLCLYLVILGHVATAGGTAFNWIFSFHMPAFFFLSGMTFHPDKYKDCKNFFITKIKKRVLPYFLISFLGFLISLCIPYYRTPLLHADPKYVLSWLFYYAQPKLLNIGQIWFLIGLFMAEVIAYFWLRLFGNKPLLLKCYAFLALLLLAVNIRRIDPYLPVGSRLPWKIDTGLGAAVFLIAGYYTSKYHLSDKLKQLSPFLVPLCIWVNYYTGPRLGGYVNICDCVYSHAVYYFLASFCGIAALVMAAGWIKNCRFWQYCGRYSLPLFAMQNFSIDPITAIASVLFQTAFIPMQNIPTRLAVPMSILMFISLAAVLKLAQFCFKGLRAAKSGC